MELHLVLTTQVVVAVQLLQVRLVHLLETEETEEPGQQQVLMQVQILLLVVEAEVLQLVLVKQVLEEMVV